VHWYITCRMEPKDIRAAMRMVLKPTAALRILKMALGFPRGRAGAEPVVEAKQDG
jgi:hypothetical protein